MSYPLVVNEAGIIEPQPINPTETFINVENSTLDSVTMLDYWVWAFSDLMGNTERGVLAEYLVARAIRAKRPVRNSWAAYDIDSPDGTKIEVKSASYVQSWHQNIRWYWGYNFPFQNSSNDVDPRYRANKYSHWIKNQDQVQRQAFRNLANFRPLH